VKLAVATIVPHLQHAGIWHSYEPFVAEMNQWAMLFEELVMIAPVEHGNVPTHWVPYSTSDRIRVIPYRRDKGKGLQQAVTSPLELPGMLLALLRARTRTTALHVRCPGSIGLLGAAIGPLLWRRRIAKFAGQWNGYSGEPRTVAWQRRLLASRYWRAPVTVYGEWPNQPSWVVPFYTSALSEAQMDRARKSASSRSGLPPVSTILFVGRLTRSKNVHVLLEAARLLADSDRKFRIEIVGDGPERSILERQAREARLEAYVHFSGGLPYEKVLAAYEHGDILVLASDTEGWGKVLAEAMAFGLICIGGERGPIPWLLGDGRGHLVQPGDANSLADRLAWVLDHPREVDGARRRAAPFAQRFTLESLRVDLRNLMIDRWKLEATALQDAAEPLR